MGNEPIIGIVYILYERAFCRNIKRRFKIYSSIYQVFLVFPFRRLVPGFHPIFSIFLRHMVNSVLKQRTRLHPCFLFYQRVDKLEQGPAQLLLCLSVGCKPSHLYINMKYSCISALFGFRSCRMVSVRFQVSSKPCTFFWLYLDLNPEIGMNSLRKH